MQISIIVPVRWSEPRVLLLLDALRGQGGGGAEVLAVVMDDGRGRAGTASLLPELQRRARVVAAAPSTPAAVRNLAAAQAQGEFLVFIDDDCLPEPRWLEQLLAAAADPAVGAVAGGVLPAPAATLTEKYLGAYGLPLPENAAVYDKVIPFVSFGHSANLLVRRAVFNELGGFAAGWPTGEDHDLCYRLIKAGHKLAFVPTAAVRHFHRATVGGMLRQAYGYGRGQIRLLKRHWPRKFLSFPRGRAPQLQPSLLTVWRTAETAAIKFILFVVAAAVVALLATPENVCLRLAPGAIILLLLWWWLRLAGQLARRVTASAVALSAADKALLPALHIARECALLMGRQLQSYREGVLVL